MIIRLFMGLLGFGIDFPKVELKFSTTCKVLNYKKLYVITFPNHSENHANYIFKNINMKNFLYE